MYFHRKKGVEGVAFLDWSWIVTNQSMILITFKLLKGVISTFKRVNVSNTGADGGLCLKRQKVLEGFLKIVND